MIATRVSTPKEDGHRNLPYEQVTRCAIRSHPLTAANR